MKLLKIIFDKKKSGTRYLVVQILDKYPEADYNSIYATLCKLGIETAFSTLRDIKCDYTRRKQIKQLMGVK